MGYLAKIFSGIEGKIHRHNTSRIALNKGNSQNSSSPLHKELNDYIEKDAGSSKEIYSPCWTSLEETTTVMVEEMASAEEEAEVFLLLGRADMAIGVLRHHIEAHRNTSPHVWMALLDIFHAQGMLGEFEKLAAEIKTRFNISKPTWENADKLNLKLSELEHLPHVLGKIISQWHDASCHSHLYSLIQDDRKGERAGFQQAVFREILFLISILEFKAK
jgi:hypothetical protein